MRLDLENAYCDDGKELRTFISFTRAVGGILGCTSVKTALSRLETLYNMFPIALILLISYLENELLNSAFKLLFREID